MNPKALIALFLTFANELKFKNLFLIVIIMLVIDLIVPDFIPFFDELLLGLIAIILANWKEKKLEEKEPEGTIIEGEVIDEDNNQQ